MTTKPATALTIILTLLIGLAAPAAAQNDGTMADPITPNPADGHTLIIVTNASQYHEMLDTPGTHYFELRSKTKAERKANRQYRQARRAIAQARREGVKRPIMLQLVRTRNAWRTEVQFHQEAAKHERWANTVTGEPFRMICTVHTDGGNTCQGAN